MNVWTELDRVRVQFSIFFLFYLKKTCSDYVASNNRRLEVNEQERMNKEAAVVNLWLYTATSLEQKGVNTKNRSGYPVCRPRFEQGTHE